MATTLRMSELTIRSKQVMRKPASTRNTISESGRIGAGTRVLRVLVVGAEQDSASAILRQVLYAGHGAHAAPDCLTALREAAYWHPDVVLLDLEPPRLDGCEVAKHLRSDHLSQDCLIIAFANGADDARRKPCVEAGIDLLLNKPVDQDVVETLLMLECVRVNRRRARKAVNTINRLTSMDHRPNYIRSKSC